MKELELIWEDAEESQVTLRITISLHEVHVSLPWLLMSSLDQFKMKSLGGCVYIYIYIYIVNDIILVDEIKHGVNVKLEVRRDALESNCFWWSRTKTK